MSINPVTFVEQPEGQPEVQSAIQEVDSQPQPLTEVRVQEIVKKSMTESMSEFYRLQKQQMDKQEARIKKDVQSQIEGLKKIGVDVTDEMATNIEKLKRQEIVTEFQNDGLSQEAGQQPTPDQSSTDPVVQAAMKEVESLEKTFGFELNDDDPEAKMVDHSRSYRFVSTYEKAMEAKKERLANEGKLPRDPMAQLPMGIGGSSPGHPLAGMKPMDKFAKAYKERK